MHRALHRVRRNASVAKSRMLLGLAALLTSGAAASAAGAQQPVRDAVPRAQVLVLGTYHFNNPGRDVVKTEVADILSPAKQAEVAAVVEALARFRPTKIAVEVRPELASRLDSFYTAYRSGQHALSRSEVQQLGFRLAERFDHPRLYPADHPGEFPFDAVMAYAQAHDSAFVSWVQRVLAQTAEESNEQQRRMTVGEILRFENDPSRIAAGHAMYLEFSRVGAGDTFVGADLLSQWYARNIRIFTELQRLAEPGDRVLVIYGAGHAAILRELVAGDARLELVETNPYLPGPG